MTDFADNLRPHQTFRQRNRANTRAAQSDPLPAAQTTAPANKGEVLRNNQRGFQPDPVEQRVLLLQEPDLRTSGHPAQRQRRRDLEPALRADRVQGDQLVHGGAVQLRVQQEPIGRFSVRNKSVVSALYLHDPLR